jgi:short-subunit dehydrogenase
MGRALITGGSKGIGASIAEALARRKVDLLIVARNEQDLKEIQLRLEQKYKITVLTMSCDLSQPETEEKLEEWVKGSGNDLNIFCHVAGMGGSRDFRELSAEELRNMIRTNFETGVELCRRMLPTLKKNAPSYILLVGSMAGFSPIPQKAIYSATKSALYFFARSLNRILKNDGVKVSCLSPGPVFTKSSIEEETIRQLGKMGKWMAMPPAEIGEYAVSQMFRGRMLIIPGGLNRFFSFLLRSLPQQLLVNLFYRKQNSSRKN